jgi:hypothetical protein
VASTSDPETDPAAGKRYSFEIASRKLSVAFDSSVVDGVIDEVLKGFGALPRRGAEIGGLLLGHEFRSGSTSGTVIEAFDPIPIEYLTGPSYHLSEADQQRLNERLTMWRQSPEHRLWVVGLYRSHTRRDFEADDQDRTQCAQIFGDRRGLLLLVKPTFTRPPAAALFFWADGKLERSAECPDFALELSPARTARGEAPPPAQAAPKVRAAAAAAGAGVSAPRVPDAHEPTAGYERTDRYPPARPATLARGELLRTEFPELHGRRVSGPPEFEDHAGLPAIEDTPEIVLPPSDRPWLRWGLIAAAVIVAAISVWYLAVWYALDGSGQPGTAGRPATTLDLNAGEAQGQLEIGWNRSAPIARNATRGLLTITDGPLKKEMEFDGEQVRSMQKVLYTRITGEVGLRLEVFAGDRSQSESIRFVSPGSPASVPPGNAATVSHPPAAAPAASAPAPPPAPAETAVQHPAPANPEAQPPAQPAATVRPPVSESVEEPAPAKPAYRRPRLPRRANTKAPTGAPKPVVTAPTGGAEPAQTSRTAAEPKPAAQTATEEPAREIPRPGRRR